MEENYYYVYIYLDPRKPGQYMYENYCFLFEPFYVGKGKEERWKDLIERNDHFKRKINKIKESDFEPIVIKVNENLFENEAFDLEIELIKLIGRKDLDEGLLVNLTDGGEGSSGYKWTEEQYEKRRTDWCLIEKTFDERGYELKSTKDEYVNGRTKLKYKHKKCETEHEICWNDFYSGNSGCSICGTRRIAEKQKTDWDLIEKTFSGRDYTLLSKKEDYINCDTKLKYRHNPCETEHEIRWTNFYNGNKGCPICGTKSTAEKLRMDWDFIVKTFTEKGYELISTKNEYKNAKTRLKFKHKKCGTIREICWDTFSNKIRSCSICEIEKRRIKKYNLIKTIFKDRNYILMTEENDYKNTKTLLEYITPDGEYKYISWDRFKIKYKIKESRYKICKEKN